MHATACRTPGGCQADETVVVTIYKGDAVRPGVIADFGYDGGVVRFEIMQASKVVENAREIQFAVSE